MDWLLRPYPHHEYRGREFLSSRIIAVGWPWVGSLVGTDERQIRDRVDRAYSTRPPSWRSRSVGSLVSFVLDLQVGDLVLVAPRKEDNQGRVMLCEVTGEYAFEESLASDEEGYPHQRTVRWVRPMIDRSKVERDLRGALSQQGVTIMSIPDESLRKVAEREGWT